jgi:hypothetical protein
MAIINRPVSPRERTFNGAVILVAKVIALALGIIAVGAYAIRGLDADRTLALLLVAFVILTLASIQDTLGLMAASDKPKDSSKDATPEDKPEPPQS